MSTATGSSTKEPSSQSSFPGPRAWPCGKGGVYVAATPDIWYFKDTDGDMKADIRQTVYTGFRKYNIQAVINNLIRGLDHRIYGVGGTNGATVRRVEGQGKSPEVQLSRNDFRFDPVTGAFEAISGGMRFGNTFDDWGNRFICNIRNPAQHVVLPSHYLARNTYLPVSSVIHDAAESGDQLPVYPISPPEALRVTRAQRWARDPTQQNVPRTLQREGGMEETILRRNIEKIRIPGISIMPDGLEAAITPQEMVDLLEFLLQPELPSSALPERTGAKKILRK